MIKRIVHELFKFITYSFVALMGYGLIELMLENDNPGCISRMWQSLTKGGGIK